MGGQQKLDQKQMFCGEFKALPIERSVGRSMFNFISNSKMMLLLGRRSQYNNFIQQLYQPIGLIDKEKMFELEDFNDKQFSNIDSFIKNVCYYNQFQEVSSSSRQGKDLNTTQDWSEAIIDFFRRIDLYQQLMDLTLNQIISNSQNWNRVCTNKNGCPAPCTKSGLFSSCSTPITSPIPQQWTSFQICKTNKTC